MGFLINIISHPINLGNGKPVQLFSRQHNTIELRVKISVTISRFSKALRTSSSSLISNVGAKTDNEVGFSQTLNLLARYMWLY